MPSPRRSRPVSSARSIPPARFASRVPRSRFVEQYRTLDGFRRSSFVLQIAKFSETPQLSDLDSLTIEPDDIKALRTCRVGACDVRLSGDDIRRVNTQVNWRAADADAQAALLFKQILLDYLTAYRTGGVERLVQYEDDAEIDEAGRRGQGAVEAGTLAARRRAGAAQPPAGLSVWRLAEHRSFLLLVQGSVRLPARSSA